MQKRKYKYLVDFRNIILCALFLSVVSLAGSEAQSDHAETAFEHGWCVGRAHAILIINPNNIEAQDVEYYAARAFVLEGLERFGFTVRNRERLVEATLQMRGQVTAQTRAYIRQVGVSQASQEVRERWLPEMRRRCQY
jgi:hypothetical protein